jgi:hypothetical protein
MTSPRELYARARRFQRLSVRSGPVAALLAIATVELKKDHHPREWQTDSPVYPGQTSLGLPSFAAPWTELSHASTISAEALLETIGNFASARETWGHPQSIRQLCALIDRSSPLEERDEALFRLTLEMSEFYEEHRTLIDQLTMLVPSLAILLLGKLLLAGPSGDSMMGGMGDSRQPH